MSPFKLALLHLLRRPLSSFIALLGIALSVGISGTLLRLYLLSGSRFESIARSGEALVGAKSGGMDLILGLNNQEGDYPAFIPLNLFLSVKAKSPIRFEDGVTAGESPVERVIPFVYFARHGNTRVMATDENFLKTAEGKNKLDLPILKEGHWGAEVFEAVAGAEAAEKLKIHLGDELVVEPWTGNYLNSTHSIKLKIVGLLESTGKAWDRSVYSNLPTAQVIFKDSDVSRKSIWHENVLHYFLIYLNPRSEAKPWIESLINERTVTQLVWVSDEILKLQRLTSTGRNLGFLISAFIIFLGAFSVAGVLIARFDGMMTQMAVLRALGFTKLKLTLVILFEALILGVMACLIGTLLDASLFPFVREALGASLPQEITISIFADLPIWIVTLFANVLSVSIPLWRVYRQNLHQTLRVSL